MIRDANHLANDKFDKKELFKYTKVGIGRKYLLFRDYAKRTETKRKK